MLRVKNTYLNIPWLHVAEQWNENIVSLFGEGGRVNEGDDFFDDDELLVLVLLLFSSLVLLLVVVVISFVVSALREKEEDDLFFAKDMRWLRFFDE